MAEGIEVTPSEVRSTCGSVAQEYSSLKALMDDMVAKFDNLSTFWSSSQANTFGQRLTSVADEYNKFYAKYEQIIEFINGAMTTYDTQAAANNSGISSYSGEGASPVVKPGAGGKPNTGNGPVAMLQ